MYCNRCGHRNPERSAFCSSCGAPLAASVSDETTASFQALEEGAEAPPGTVALEALPHGAAMLVVQRGPNAGSRFLLDRELTRVGRHPEADILLDDVTVSRKHAEILRTEEGHVVRDVGSLNGTYLNRQRVEEALLRNGDELQIGRFRLVYYAGAGELG